MESWIKREKIGAKEYKLAKWKEMLEKVEQTKDSLGLHIDEGMKETIALLWCLGFQTTSSCEGHIERGLPYPWVEFCTPEPTGLKEAKGKIKKKLRKQWEEENFKQRKKLIKLLQEFYSNRLEEFYKRKEVPYDTFLTLEPLGAYGTFRLQSLGARGTENLSLEEKERILKLYQEEMKRFTEFLKIKYFEN
jgi:hypothetical protein